MISLVNYACVGWLENTL